VIYLIDSFIVALSVSIFSIAYLIPVATRFGLVDKASGHKKHSGSVPLLGGIGVYISLAVFIVFMETVGLSMLHISLPLFIASGLLFTVGLYDDVHCLSVKVRVFFQFVAVMIMSYYGGVYLTDLGSLLSEEVIQLGMWSIPLTIIATIGVINSVNLIDGIDGLSGMLSLTSLTFLALVTWMAGSDNYLMLTLSLMGALTGFLLFNLRRKDNRRAAIYLGDAGSTLIGFQFAWLFIALSQGEAAAMAPVSALWFFSVPLMDTLTTMMRRILNKKSPFNPDRTHLHHSFLQAGYTIADTVTAITLIQLTLGVVGLVAHVTRVSEVHQFQGFLLAFGLYFALTVRHEKFVSILKIIHLKLGLIVERRKL